MTAARELEAKAMDRVMDAGLRMLAERERGRGHPAGTATPRAPRPWMIAAALLALGITVALAVFGGGPEALVPVQDPHEEQHWGPFLAEVPIVESRDQLDALPAGIPAIRLLRPDPDMVAGLARMRSLRAVGVGTDDRMWRLEEDVVNALLRHTRIVALQIDNTPAVSLPAIAAIGRFPGLRELRFTRTRPPQDWSPLSTLGLRRLAIEFAGFGDSALHRVIKALPSLEALELVGPMRVGVKGLLQLERLRELHWLALRDRSELDSEALAAVAAVPRLRVLDLSGSTVTEPEAFEPLRRHPGLEILSLAKTRGVTVAHLEDIVTAPNLTALDLQEFAGLPFDHHGRSRILTTDAVRVLVKAPKLRRVGLRDVHGLRIDALIEVAADNWTWLDLRGAKLSPPLDSPAGSSDLEITDPEGFKAMLKVDEVLLTSPAPK